MFIYTVIEALAGLVLGIIIAGRSKKSEGVVYGALDKVGFVTNILLIPVYALISHFAMFIGMISEPLETGFLGVIGAIIGVIIASVAMFCALGLGFSVSLRKKGKSKISFAVQFVGILAIILGLALYAIFVDTLIAPLN